MLDYLDYQLQDITKAVGLQKILDKVDDIVNSSDSVGVFKFLVANFPSRVCSKDSLEKLLVACFENGNMLLVEYIHDNNAPSLKEAHQEFNGMLPSNDSIVTVFNISGAAINQCR